MEKDVVKNTRVLSEKQKKLISDNWGLLITFYNREMGRGYIPSGREDEFLELLHNKFCNSALSFDENMGFKFSTYVYGGFKFCAKEIKDRMMKEFRIKSLLDEENCILDSRRGDNKGRFRFIWNSIRGWVDSPVDHGAIIDLLDMSSLTERERRAIELYFFEDKTHAQLGEELGLSRERSRQILLKAISKVKEFAYSEDYNIEDFIKNE